MYPQVPILEHLGNRGHVFPHVLLCSTGVHGDPLPHDRSAADQNEERQKLRYQQANQQTARTLYSHFRNFVGSSHVQLNLGHR